MAEKHTPKAGWSWGAFMFHAAFLIGIKRYKMLWWYLFMLVPLLNIIFLIVFSIYLGVNGHELAATSTQFASQAEYDGYFKGVDHAGKIFFFAALVAVAAWVILLILGLSISFLAPRTQGFRP